MKWQSAAALTISVIWTATGQLMAQTLPPATEQIGQGVVAAATPAKGPDPSSLEEKLIRLEQALELQRQEINYLKEQLLSQIRGNRHRGFGFQTDIRFDWSF